MTTRNRFYFSLLYFSTELRAHLLAIPTSNGTLQQSLDLRFSRKSEGEEICALYDLASLFERVFHIGWRGIQTDPAIEKAAAKLKPIEDQHG